MNPTLRTALASLLPSARQTLLLRTCLLAGDPARAAWRRFSAAARDPASLFRIDRGRLNRLAPLLLRALRREELSADADLLTVLRTARLREELRAEAYRDILRSVLRALRERDVPVLLLKGAALGETVYPDPVLRHSHDIDLLVRPRDRAAAAGALAGIGFERKGDPYAADDEEVHVHRSGLPVRLHARLFRPRPHDVDREGLWRRRGRLSAGGERAYGLSPADALLHALGHASYCPGRDTLLWVCDASLILRSTSEPDWERLVEAAASARLAIPVHLMLEYLAEELDAPVPSGVLGDLRARARTAERFERDLALSAARESRRSGLGKMLAAATGPLEKLRLAWWILFPSPAYVRWAHGVELRRRVWLTYLLRPISVAARRLRRGLARLGRTGTGRVTAEGDGARARPESP